MGFRVLAENATDKELLVSKIFEEDVFQRQGEATSSVCNVEVLIAKLQRLPSQPSSSHVVSAHASHAEEPEALLAPCLSRAVANPPCVAWQLACVSPGADEERGHETCAQETPL